MPAPVFYSPLTNTQEYGLYKNITADTLIKTGAGNIQAIVVNSHSSGAIKLYDNTAASGTVIINTYTYASGSQIIWLFGIKFLTGLYADVTNAQDITIVYN